MIILRLMVENREDRNSKNEISISTKLFWTSCYHRVPKFKHEKINVDFLLSMTSWRQAFESQQCPTSLFFLPLSNFSYMHKQRFFSCTIEPLYNDKYQYTNFFLSNSKSLATGKSSGTGNFCSNSIKIKGSSSGGNTSQYRRKS